MSQILGGSNQMNIESDNLVNLDKWKSIKKEDSFSEYLKVLSFNDLLNESNELAERMNKSEDESDLFSKTRLMMNEFTNRLERESKNLAGSVKELKKHLEDKLH